MIVALVQNKDKQPRWIIKLDFCILDHPSSITFSGGMQPVCLPVKQLIPWKLNDFKDLAWNVQSNIYILTLLCLCVFICLSAQSIVHLTAQIQIKETRIANFFWGCTGPYFGPTNTINTKNYQKNTRGPIFRKTTQNALQCTTVHCNVTP